MSIRTRLLLIALLAVLLPVLVVLTHFVEDRRKGVEVDTQHLAAIAADKVGDLADRIRGTVQLQFGLARAADLAGTDRAQCSAFLSQVREAHPQYTGILTILPNGRLFCDSLKTGRELDLNDRDYFRRALAARPGEVVLEPAFGRLSGRAVMQVATPVRQADGSLRFVLLASLDLAKVVPIDGRQVPGARLLMVDDKGQVLAVAPSGAAGLEPGASIAGTRLWEFAKAAGSAAHSELDMPDGRRFSWARADTLPIAGAGVRVLAGAPTADLVAAADRGFARDVGLLGAVAVALFAAIGLIAERAIRRPIERISGLTSALARATWTRASRRPCPRASSAP
jgi:hypothetical protein